tara:strand:- start:55218 stop:57650 length:2433 start_codon:yes stop_codon:yes gene_type:complete
VKYIFYLIILGAFSTQAQNYTLTGKVIDAEKKPVAFTNILLLHAADSTFVKGSVSEDDGSFVIESVENGSYLVRSSFVGFKDNYSQVFEVSQDVRIPVIVLEEEGEFLDEVTVVAKRPTIQRKIDRLVYNVENSVVSSGSTYDILRKTPGVIVQQDNLMIKNTPATVYINDRRVYLSATELRNLLEGFSGENVKAIEIITNPPAKYDAQGGAILNITTSRNPSIGYKGSVNASNTIAILPKYTLGTTHYYKTKGVDIFANYTYNTRSDYKEDDSYINFFDTQENVDSRWRSNFDKTTRTSSHNFNTIFDFTLNDKNSLSFSSNILLTPKQDSDIAVNTEISNAQNQLDSSFITDSRLKDDRKNILLNATYKSVLDENGSEFSVTTNYIRYDDDQDQGVATDYLDPEGALLRRTDFATEANQINDIFTGQLDIIKQGASSTFEGGLKFTTSDSKSNYDFYNSQGDIDSYNENISDNFKYSENIYAAYTSYSKDWEKWSLKAGLRVEYTDIQGNSFLLGEVNTQEYTELFPSAYFMHSPNENNTFVLNYNRRIIRPDFASLNPYRYYLNENNFQAGNPDLRPGIENKISFDYILKQDYNFSIYYQHVNNSLQSLGFQNNAGRYKRSLDLNVDYTEEYGVDFLYGSSVTNWWYLNFVTSFFYSKVIFPAIESENLLVKNDVYANYSVLGNYFTLSNDGTFSGDITGYFLSNNVSGSYTWDRPQASISFGLRKTFFSDRLVTTASVEDILNTLNLPLSSQYLNQDNGFFAKSENRFVRFGIKYNFGNFKLSDNERSTDAEERDRIKKKEFLPQP